jgi:F0F1-type ATP synthase assembly protein I
MKSADPTVPDGDDPAKSNQWLAFLNLGWLIMLNMLVFAGGGLWLDRRFRTAPWLLLTGVLLGFSGSGYTLLRAVKNLEATEAKKPRKGDETKQNGNGPGL